MSGEEKSNGKISQAEARRGGLIIPEIISADDLTGENAVWIDNRSEFYINQLNSKYAAAKEQFPQLKESAAKILEKKFTQWPAEIEDIKEKLFDLWEEAVNIKNSGEKMPSALVKEMNILVGKLNDYFAQIEKQGIVSSDRINMEETESYEEAGFKEVEKIISAGRDELSRCRESFELIESSVYKELYDENFLRKLTDFARKLGIVEGWLDQLEEASRSVKVRLEKEDLSDNEIQDMFNNLSKTRDSVRNNVETLGRGIERVGKEVEKGKEERQKLIGRIEALIDRIEGRMKRGIYSGKNTEKLAGFMLERLSEMKNKPLTIESVRSVEREAEETIFAPEVRSDEKKEKMDIQYFWKRRVLDEKKRLDKMIGEFEAAQDILRRSSKATQERMGQVGKALAVARGRSDILIDALDSINTPKEETLDSIKFQLESYKEEYLEAEKAYSELSPELAKAAFVSLRPKLDSALSKINEKYITPKQKAMLEGWKTVFEKGGDYNLEEIADFTEKLEDVLAVVDEKQKEYLAKVETGLKEEALEREFMAKGDKMKAVPEKKEVAPSRAIKAKRGAEAQVKTEEEFFGEKAFAPEAEKKIKKDEVLTGIKEMLEEQGIIDLKPEKILALMTPAELDSLIENIKDDAREKSDNNRDAFERSMRTVINERLLKSLDAGKREKLSVEISAQAYSILKGAVEAESQKEIARLEAGQASKLAKTGKLGAGLVANIALASGIGIGAGLIIGSGGAAAAVAGASIAAARLARKAIGKSEIFQAAKEKAASLWNKTAGKLFKKEKSPVDAEKVLEDTVKKFISPEIIAAILSNQLRENSSQDLLNAVNAYGRAKTEAVRRPNAAASERFESSLDDVSREFYKKSYNYLAMYYKSENVPDETLAKMALQMTLDFSIYQRNEVRIFETLETEAVKSKMPEEKHWLVNRMEHLMKFRSEGAGSVLFGGALAYAVSETTSAGRVVSGALAGAGLGLMIERKTRKSEAEKLHKVVEDIITRTEKKLFGKDAVILPNELAKANKDASYIRAQLDTGVFDKNTLLKNRAENFIVRVNQEMMKTYEAPSFSVDDLLRDVSKQTKQMEKESAKILKKTSEAFKTKDRALAYMTVGALLGGAAGYLGTRLSEYIRGPKPEEIKLSEVPEKAPELSFAYAPHEKVIPPLTPLEPIPEQAASETVAPEIPAHEPVEEIVMPVEHVKARHGGEMSRAVEEAVKKTPRRLAPVHEEAVAKDGGPVEVAEVYRASIYEYPKKEPLFFTREEELQIKELTEKGDTEALSDFISKARARGQIYEDLKTGKQYHADELNFAEEGTTPSEAEQVAADQAADRSGEPVEKGESGAVVEDEDEIKFSTRNPYDEQGDGVETELDEEKAVPEPTAVTAREIPDNPYDEPEVPAQVQAEVAEPKADEGSSAKADIEQEEPEAEAESEEDLRAEAERVTRAAESRMASELKSVKERDAYDWLSKNVDSNRLTIDEKMAVRLLKDDFVKDMLDDGKISPKLLREIDTWKNRIQFEL